MLIRYLDCAVSTVGHLRVPMVQQRPAPPEATAAAAADVPAMSDLNRPDHSNVAFGRLLIFPVTVRSKSMNMMTLQCSWVMSTLDAQKLS